MENVLFRTAVGGFHRKDVMDYLEQQTREHGEALAKCQKELDNAREDVNAMMSAMAGAEAKMESAILAREEAAEEWEQKQSELEDAQKQAEQLEAELAQTKEALAACKTELAQVRQQLDFTSGEAKSYESVKSRLSTIELAAHQRAAEVERAAELEAENIQRKARETILSLQIQYELAVSALAAGRVQVTGQLQDMQAALDALSPALEQSGRAFVTLCEERCKQKTKEEQQ